MSRVRNFCITINNYKEENIEAIKSMPIVKYGIIGKEVGEKGTPHLQGYVQLKKQQTIKAFQKKLKAKNIRAHIEVSKGNAEQNKKYCSKDGLAIEWGIPKKQGSRSDLEEMYEMVKEKATTKEIREKHPGSYMRYYKAVDRVKTEIQQEEAKEYMVQAMAKETPREWQTKMIEELEEQDDRQILWIEDREGNKGKTWLAKWLVVNKDAYYIQGGKSADIAYAYANQEYVIFDFTRSQEERINYSVIESFKNGLLFSPKYESQMKVFKPAKVICLSNFSPDQTKLSEDRWNIIDLD